MSAKNVVTVGGVVVHDDEGSTVYLQGDTVPAKHVKLITNPAVFASEESAPEPDPTATV